MELGRSRGTVPLICFIFFMAKGRGRTVKCDGNIIRSLLFNDFSHDGQKAIDSIGMHTVRRRHGERHSVKGTEHDTVTVYQNKFFIHIYNTFLQV